MSISPFQPEDNPLPWRSSAPQPPQKTNPDSTPLTLSQALIITGGMAGLIGLLGGGVMRFSLAHSSTASFLSPLQTFPALSDWSPELPQGTADSHYLPGGTRRDSWETDSPANYDPASDSEAVYFERGAGFEGSNSAVESPDSNNFDAWSRRGENTRPAAEASGRDPWETLRNGPELGTRNEQPGAAPSPDYAGDYDTDYDADYSADSEPGDADPGYIEPDANADYFDTAPFTELGGESQPYDDDELAPAPDIYPEEDTPSL